MTEIILEMVKFNDEKKYWSKYIHIFFILSQGFVKFFDQRKTNVMILYKNRIS